MTEPTTTFTPEDLPDLIAAQQRQAEFEEFVLGRFLAWTSTNDAVDDRGGALSPVTDAAGKTNGGWGGWRLITKRFTSTPDGYQFEHWMADNRGPSIKTTSATVPASFVFLPEDEQRDYEAYLALKSRFEPRS